MSLLSDLQNRLRRNLAQVPGYAGGNLQGQLDRQQPKPTLADQAIARAQPVTMAEDAIGRAVPVTNGPPPPDPLGHRLRKVNLPPEMKTGVENGRKRVVTYDLKSGRPDREFYRSNPDQLEGSQNYHNAVQSWEPRGGKRGWKNSLKAGALMAAEAVRTNPSDPVTAAIAGFGVGAGGAAAVPNLTNRLRRNLDLRQSGQELASQLGLAKDQAQVEALRVRPQMQQATLDEREINNALTQYNRLEHYDPDDPVDSGWKRYFESRGIRLPKKDKYRRPIATWANGQLVLTDRTGTRVAEIDGQPVIDAARMPTEVKVGDQTFKVPQSQAARITAQTAEGAANRGAADTRSRRTQEGQNQRLRERLNTSPSRGTSTTGKTDRVTQRRAAKLIGDIEYQRKAMAAAESRLAKAPNNEQALQERAVAQAEGERAAAELNTLNAGYESGPGEKGFPYWKKLEGPRQKQQTAGRTIEGAIKAFKVRVKRDPTAEEVSKMKAVLSQ